jgi:hypothetical protein
MESDEDDDGEQRIGKRSIAENAAARGRSDNDYQNSVEGGGPAEEALLAETDGDDEHDINQDRARGRLPDHEILRL